MGKSRKARKQQLRRAKPVPPHDSAEAIAEAEVLIQESAAAYDSHDSVLLTLINNLADAVFAHDLDGNFVLVNSAACRHVGYSEEELLQMTVADIDAGSMTRDDRRKFWLTLNPGDKAMIQVRHRRRDGTEYPAEVHLNRVELDNQPIILGVARDSTDLLRAQDSQHRTQQMLLQSQRIARTGSFCRDLRTGKVTWSDEQYRIFGYKPGEIPLSFERTVQLVHPDDRERFVAANENLVERNQPYDGEYRFLRADGATIWVRSKAVLETDETGQAIRVVGAAQDITDIVTLRQEREHERKLMRTMLDSSPEAMFLIKTDGTIVAANKSLGERFNMSTGRIIGSSVYSLLDDEVASFRRARIEEVIETRSKVVFEDIRDGMVLYHTLEPVLNGDGEVEYVAIHGADLSGIRHIEAELEQKQLLLTQAERNKKAELEQVFNAISDAVLYADVNRRIVFVNPAFTRIFGYSMEEVEGRFTKVIYVSDDEFEAQGAIRYNPDSPADYSSYEIKYRKKSGEVFLSETVGTAVFDTSHKLLGFLALIRDITEKKAAENALKESQRFAQMIADTTPSLLYIYDIAKDCNIWVNAANRELLNGAGVTDANDCCAGNAKDWIHPDDIHGLLERLEYLEKQRDGKWVEIEYRFRVADGSWRWFSDRAAAFERHADGSLSKVIGSAVDINDAKHSQQRLQEQVHFLQRLMDTIPGPLYFQDSDGRMMGCNKAFESFFGKSRQALIGHRFSDLCPRETWPDIIHKDRELHARGGTQIFEARLINGDNETRSIVLYRASFESSDNETTGIIGVLIDITDRRRMERELFKAEKLDSIGVLAGGIAHDFNNILVAILGNISLARMEIDEGDEIAEMLEAAEKATERAQHLTHQLLTFAKGGAPIRKAADAGTILRETAEFALRGSNARGEFYIDKNLKAAEFDEGQFTQVINNLVINAVQAMPTGGIIQLRAENFQVGPITSLPLAPGSYLRISISDQGIGISPENVTRIFDPFFTTKDKGSGLGLASCYSIIKAHEGHIDVSSRLGIGSTFTIYLPATDKKPGAPSRPSAEMPGGSGRILIMDDEEPLRRLTSQALNRLGYTPEVASNGSEAISQYKKAFERGQPFDMVILDLTVPGGMGGQNVLRELKRLDPDVRAVVSSGYSSDPVLANFRQRGFCGRLIKPFKVSDLANLVKDVLSETTRA